ncbi:hypothetical protein GEMRC1_001241 [Eukaryota sp. GEM-RC1]
MPMNFHAYISHGVIDLLKMTLPAALSSQPELWEYLISLTLCSSDSEARSLLSSLSTDNSMHSPTTRLNKYLLDFRLTIPRCRHCINKLSPVIESFNKGISIRSVNNALWDEFKCGNITDLGDLVRFTMKTFEHLNALSWTLAIRPPILPRNNRIPKNFTNWPRPHSDYGTPSSRPFSSLSNSKSQDFETRSPLNNGTPSERFCNYCKKSGNTIDFCRDPDCNRSKFSNTSPQTKKKPRNPTLNRTYSTRHNSVPR